MPLHATQAAAYVAALVGAGRHPVEVPLVRVDAAVAAAVERARHQPSACAASSAFAQVPKWRRTVVGESGSSCARSSTFAPRYSS